MLDRLFSNEDEVVQSNVEFLIGYGNLCPFNRQPDHSYKQSADGRVFLVHSFYFLYDRNGLIKRGATTPRDFPVRDLERYLQGTFWVADQELNGGILLPAEDYKGRIIQSTAISWTINQTVNSYNQTLDCNIVFVDDSINEEIDQPHDQNSVNRIVFTNVSRTPRNN